MWFNMADFTQHAIAHFFEKTGILKTRAHGSSNEEIGPIITYMFVAISHFI